MSQDPTFFKSYELEKQRLISKEKEWEKLVVTLNDLKK